MGVLADYQPAIGVTWTMTPRLRWYRPPGAGDTDKVLQQCWVSEFGQEDWREIETVLAD